MKVVILGNSQAGQANLFSILTGAKIQDILQKPLDLHKGISDVIDPRIITLKKMYNPKKTTFAKIEYTLLPDFSSLGQVKTIIFNELKNSDEICFVSRSENAKEDVDKFISEIVFSDFTLVEKRLETIEKDQKKKFALEREKEKNLMLLCKDILESGKLLKELALNPDEEKFISTYQFITKKPIIIVINSTDTKANHNDLQKYFEEKYNLNSIVINAELEEEINQLPQEERETFMKELGIDEPTVNKMTRMVFEGLGLISFFTVGEDEVRAWPIKKGSSAPQAGKAIHSDIEKGFVRAEMFKFDDLIAVGSEAKLKEQGKFYLKGRDYIVEDGDILSFRFNV